jgi:transposase
MNNITSHEQELLTIIAELQAQNAKLKTENAAMQKRLAELETQLAKLGKNSSTSSKPPSSDIVKSSKTPKANPNQKRKKGGQPGHPKHVRPPFESKEVDNVTHYTP